MIYTWVSFSLELTTSASCCNSPKRKWNLAAMQNAKSEEGKDGPYDDVAMYLKKGYAYKVADWHKKG